MSDEDRLLTDAEIEAYDREIQAAGSANCWTGTAGSIAAHARRLVKTLRVEREVVHDLQRTLGIAMLAKPAKPPAKPEPSCPPEIEVPCYTCDGIADLYPTCPDCGGRGKVVKINSPAEPWKYHPKHPGWFTCSPEEYERRRSATNAAAALRRKGTPDRAPGEVRTLPAGWNVRECPRFQPPRLIGFTGPAGCGKDLAASLIPAAVRVGFADALYAGLAAMLGVPEAELRDRSRKEHPIAVGCPSPRRLLQTLGTEWGRGCVSKDLWVTLAVRRWEEAWKGAVTIVVPDVRFQNEAEAIRDHGGQVWRIIRDVPPIAAGHVSEAGLRKELVDREIRNDGTIADLRANVLEAYVQAGWAPSGGTAQPSTEAG